MVFIASAGKPVKILKFSFLLERKKPKKSQLLSLGKYVLPDTADKPVGLLIVDWNVKIRLLGVLAISNSDVRCGHGGVGDPARVLDVDEVGV